MSAPALSSRARAGLVIAGLALLAFLRAPYVLTSGRFWAEEGSTYFARAVIEGPWAGLTFVYQRAGYFHLFANAGTWLASLLPLSVAPLATAWLSYLLVLVLLWVTITWPSELLPTSLSKYAAASLLLVGALAHPEVWLNTINTQTYLGVLAVLLLYVKLEDLSRTRFIISGAILGVGGLSGLYCAILAPLFVVRALRKKTFRASVHASVVAGAALIQGALVLASRMSDNLVETKFVLPQLSELFTSVAGFHIASIFLGREEATRLTGKALVGDSTATFAVLLVGALIVGLVVYTIRQSSLWVAGSLLGAFLLTELLVQVGSHGSPHARYTVVPIAIIFLAVAHGAGSMEQRTRQGIALGIIAVSLIVGLGEFWTHSPETLACLECPDWKQQIQQWESDPSTELSIWPYPRWTMKLP